MPKCSGEISSTEIRKGVTCGYFMDIPNKMHDSSTSSCLVWVECYQHRHHHYQQPHHPSPSTTSSHHISSRDFLDIVLSIVIVVVIGFVVIFHNLLNLIIL